MLKTLKIITDKKKLRKKSQLVLDIDSQEIQGLIDDMFETLKKKKGVGLAAVQIDKMMRVFIIDWENQKQVFINPKIEKLSKKQIVIEEGCLSVPGIYKDVERSMKVTVSAVDRYGKKIKLKADGMLARIIQHEYDHLEGVLFIDRIKDIKSRKNKLIC